MNLFSRISEILNDRGEPISMSTPCAYGRVDHLLRAMEKNLGQVRRFAVGVIAAERAAARELSRQLHRKERSEILVNRLQEEYALVLLSKNAVKQDLREMREGMAQAVQFRATLLRLRNIEERKTPAVWRRLFWRIYHRLCNLVDERLDRAELHNRV
jgi:phage shock protein A